MAEKPLVKNAADPEQVRQAGEKEKRNKEKAEDDVYTILSTPQGRRFFYRMIKECGVYSTSFDSNPHRMAFLEGQRNVGLSLLAQMNESRPEAYALMMKENK